MKDPGKKEEKQCSQKQEGFRTTCGTWTYLDSRSAPSGTLIKKHAF
jgi:hypothetical protein